MLGRNSQRPGPGPGTLPPSWLDLPMLHSALRKVLTEDRGLGDAAASLQYGEPAGDPRLRAALSDRIADFGVHAAPSQILTAVGATQAREHHPRLYVTVSVLHNPTGGMLSLSTAHRLLQLAQDHDLQILEDDTYAHLAPAHAPRLDTLDGLRRHAERVCARLDAARSRSVQLALGAGCGFVCPPQGLFGWVETGVDTEQLAQRLLDADWLMAPGSLFHARRQPSTRMRINFATAQDAGFWQAFSAARDALQP